MTKPVKKKPTAKDAAPQGTPAPALNDKARAKWEAAAAKVPLDAPRAGVPWSVLMGEAADVARFVRNHWDPVEGDPRTARPGLSTVASRISLAIADEIEELKHLAETAQSAYLLASAPPPSSDVRPKAEKALSELSRALDFLFDDDVEDERDRQLATLRSTHADTGPHDALASALINYAALAETHREALCAMGGFKGAVIDDARTLAAELQKIPTPAERAQRGAESDKQRALRDGLAALLMERMRRVRSAARWVFRDHPDVARLSTSAFSRDRRTATRKEKVSEEKKPDEKKPDGKKEG